MGDLPRSLPLRLAAVSAVCATAVIGLAGASYASIESSYLSILNHERATHGLAPLRMNAELTGVAQSWSAAMAQAGVLRHNPAATSEVRNWRELGENVGDGGNLRDLADAFWASPEHRRNILDPDYTQVGIAAVVADHRIWLTVEFRDPQRQVVTTSQPRGASRTSERAYPGRLLMRGTRGPAVAYVQRLLDLVASGVFGARTQAAVLVFQRQQHLVVDGIVGPNTWAALTRART